MSDSARSSWRKFGVSRIEIAGVLAEQWADVDKSGLHVPEPVEPLTPAEVRLRRPLGELLVMRGYITSEQLSAALEEQRKSGARIGEILVERGAITRLDLAAALADHEPPARGRADPRTSPTRSHSHNGAPAVSAQAWSDDDRAVVADLEARLHALERAAGGAPWQEDLRLVAFDIRAAVSAVEERLEVRASGQAEELVAIARCGERQVESLEQTTVPRRAHALRLELEELKTRPRPEEGIENLRTAVERLEALPDRSDEIRHLAGEVASLAARFDEFPGGGELQERLEAIAERSESVQTGIDGLSRRVDELSGLGGRLEELAASVPTVQVIEELRGELARLAAVAESGGGDHGAEIVSLGFRLEELAGRVEEVAAVPVPDLAPRIDDLWARVEEVASGDPGSWWSVGGVGGVGADGAGDRGVAGRVGEACCGGGERWRRPWCGDRVVGVPSGGAGGAGRGGRGCSGSGSRSQDRRTLWARVEEMAVVPVPDLAPRIDDLCRRRGSRRSRLFRFRISLPGSTISGRASRRWRRRSRVLVVGWRSWRRRCRRCR